MSEFNLPEGWIFAAIGDLCDLINGRAFKQTEWREKGLPIIRIQNLNKANAMFNYFDGELEEKHLVNYGDLLFAWSGTPGTSFGAHEWRGEQGVLNQHIFKLVFDGKHIDKSFFLHSINFKLNELIGNANGGVGLRHVTKGVFESTLLEYPPLAEQQQIAQKLDELLAQVDTLKTRLDAIPKILKRFRQSVLAAAVSGKLTEDAEARKFKSLGEAGVSVKTGPFGSALHKEEYVSGGIPLVNPMHINDGKITPSDHMSVTEKKFSELLAWELKPGDVILGRRGEMGRAAVVKPNSPKMLCGTGSMVLRGDDSVLPEYLCMILRSSVAIDYFNKDAVGSTMVNLNQKVIKALEVFFPPLEEQTEIVRRVEQLFAYADQIEQRVKDAQARVNHLTQSILAKAFRGELTAEWRAQNPELISGENSAAALLERIKAERGVVATKKRVKK